MEGENPPRNRSRKLTSEGEPGRVVDDPGIWRMAITPQVKNMIRYVRPKNSQRPRD
jgi:hypothetical protein